MGLGKDANIRLEVGELEPQVTSFFQAQCFVKTALAWPNPASTIYELMAQTLNKAGDI